MKRFKNILFVAAPDTLCKDALNRATKLADHNQASLTVIRVIDKIPAAVKHINHVLSPEKLQVRIIAEQQQELAERIASQNLKAKIQSIVLVGIPFLKIIGEVIRNNYDLVIKKAENPGFLEQLFGSDDMHLLRKCPCPVWLLKPEGAKTYKRILAAVDVDDDYPPEDLKTRHQLNLQILEMASSLAISEFAELHVVTIWDAVGESTMRRSFTMIPEDEIRDFIEETKQQYQKNLEKLINEVTHRVGQKAVDYLDPQIHMLKGPARREIPILTKDINIDLIVMGTVSRTGIPGFFMGNTAESVLYQINCSVLAVKPHGFVTPVVM